ncbi:hypothetical protein F2Q70_00036285 [Brassica cretica]|uniref:Uncharacterized protein n=1 Tax=Brassica cretica TaxID=69181 RepID=A0A8S9JWG0_BRACR|nr:hypothetical protein F2Q70_00036285 [Brassica cretica]
MLATGTEKTNQTIGGAQAQRAPLPAGLESIWRRDHSSASSRAGIVVNGPVGVVEEVDVDVDVGVSVGFVVVVDVVEKIVAELAVVEHE